MLLWISMILVTHYNLHLVFWLFWQNFSRELFKISCIVCGKGPRSGKGPTFARKSNLLAFGHPAALLGRVPKYECIFWYPIFQIICNKYITELSNFRDFEYIRFDLRSCFYMVGVIHVQSKAVWGVIFEAGRLNHIFNLRNPAQLFRIYHRVDTFYPTLWDFWNPITKKIFVSSDTEKYNFNF